MKYNEYVIRRIGDCILLVNIKENEIYEIDEFICECVEQMKKHGHIDWGGISKEFNLDYDEAKEEWLEIKCFLGEDR